MTVVVPAAGFDGSELASGSNFAIELPVVFQEGAPIIALDATSASELMLQGVVAHTTQRFTRPAITYDNTAAAAAMYVLEKIVPVAVVRSQFVWNFTLDASVAAHDRREEHAQQQPAEGSFSPCRIVAGALNIQDTASHYAGYVAYQEGVAAADIMGVFAQCTDEDAAFALLTIDAVFVGQKIGTGTRRVKHVSDAVFEALTANETTRRFHPVVVLPGHAGSAGFPAPARQTHMQHSSVVDLNTRTLTVLTSVILQDSEHVQSADANKDGVCASHSKCRCSEQKLPNVFHIGDVCKCQCSNILSHPPTPNGQCSGQMFGIMVFKTDSVVDNSDTFKRLWHSIAPLFQTEANAVLTTAPPVNNTMAGNQGIVSCAQAVPERLWVQLHTRNALSPRQCRKLGLAVPAKFSAKRYVFGVAPGETSTFQLDEFVPFMCKLGNTTLPFESGEQSATRAVDFGTRTVSVPEPRKESAPSVALIMGVLLIALSVVCLTLAVYIRRYWFRPPTNAAWKMHEGLGQAFFEDNFFKSSQGFHKAQSGDGCPVSPGYANITDTDEQILSSPNIFRAGTPRDMQRRNSQGTADTYSVRGGRNPLFNGDHEAVNFALHRQDTPFFEFAGSDNDRLRRRATDYTSSTTDPQPAPPPRPSTVLFSNERSLHSSRGPDLSNFPTYAAANRDRRTPAPQKVTSPLYVEASASHLSSRNVTSHGSDGQPPLSLGSVPNYSDDNFDIYQTASPDNLLRALDVRQHDLDSYFLAHPFESNERTQRRARQPVEGAHKLGSRTDSEFTDQSGPVYALGSNVRSPVYESIRDVLGSPPNARSPRPPNDDDDDDDDGFDYPIATAGVSFPSMFAWNPGGDLTGRRSETHVMREVAGQSILSDLEYQNMIEDDSEICTNPDSEL